MFLLFAFFIGGFIGKKMTQFYAKFAGLDKNVPYFKNIDATRNYPYFYLYKLKIQGLFNKDKRLLYRYKPSVPVVYLYGTKKPFQFHG